MEFTINVSVNKDSISEKEKSDRAEQFKQSFVAAAIDYYTAQTAEANIAKTTVRKRKYA